MSKLLLESESLVNFMGCKSLTVKYNEDITLIYATNSAGKTRLEDAFNWCLFGKNSAGKSDFTIKDTKNPEMHQADHEVSLIFQKNGFKENPKRILRQKYDKEGNYVGNDTICYWNDVQLKVGEYDIRVNSMIREQVFRMITNVNFFNDDKLTPKAKRRDILVNLAGGFISDEDVAGDNKDYKNLLIQLADENKSIVDLEKQVKQQITKINGDIDKIQPSIDEITRNMPDEKDFTEVETSIAIKKVRIYEIDSILQDKSKAIDAINSAKQAKQLELHKLKTRLNQVKFEVEQSVKNKVNQSGSGKTSLVSAVTDKEITLSIVKTSGEEKVKERQQYLNSKRMVLEGWLNTIEDLKVKITALQDRWAEENMKTLPEVTDTCPSCKQSLPSENIEAQKEEIKKNWNEKLLSVKSDIENNGKLYNKELKETNELIETIKRAISTAEAELQQAKDDLSKSVKAAEAELLEANKALEIYVEPTAIDVPALILESLSANTEYLELSKGINTIDAELAAPNEEQQEDDNTEIKAEKSTLQQEIDTLNQQLGTKSVIEQNKARIKEHKANGKIWASELAKLLGSKNTIRDFNRSKITSLEERINGKFQFTSFKMFKELVNGELEDDCEAIYGERPYSALNTADKINCSLDVINTLSTHYDISAPIFVDNRESIVKLIPVASQTIQLIVSGDDKELRVV